MNWFKRKEPEIHSTKRWAVVREEVPVFGDMKEIALYEVIHELVYNFHGAQLLPRTEVLGTYLSCVEAFKAHPGAKVVQRTVWKLGGKYYKTNTAIEVKLSNENTDA